MKRRVWAVLAWLTRCPCRDTWYLDHRARTVHIRNELGHAVPDRRPRIHAQDGP